MTWLDLEKNKLTGKHFFAHIDRLVYESTIDGFVPGNALAGTIPTEIGQLAQLLFLDMGHNQLTGMCPKNSLDCNWYTSVPRT